VKNFPNQFNDPKKFRKALESIRDLRAEGKDPYDEVVLGTEFARRGIYKLGGRGSFTQRLAAERRKPDSSQGTKTVARETRTTLIHLDFINSAMELTKSGNALLASKPFGEEEKGLWRTALLSLHLEDDRTGETFHPVVILLRLVEQWPFVHRDGMELALEARNDSRTELRRLLQLVKIPSEARLEKLGIKKSQQNNARKIFPALAEHADLIERRSSRHPYTLTGFGKQAVGASGELRQLPRRDVSSNSRSVPLRSVPRQRRKGQRSSRPAPHKILTPAEQIAAEQLLYERTSRHEDLVDLVMTHLPAGRKAPVDDRFSFDLLVDPGGDRDLLLLEMKTLEADAVSQTRRAVGQLLFYEKVMVPQTWPSRRARPAAVFESAIPEHLSAFLQAVGIGSIWCDEHSLHPLNKAGRRIVKALQGP
jgi:hypothetical protein